MIILVIIVHLFTRKDIYASLFSSAFSEAVKDTFGEMGNTYHKDRQLKGISAKGLNKKDVKKVIA